MKLVLIRHSQPGVDSGICYGKTDLPLRHPAAATVQALLQRLRAGTANQTPSSAPSLPTPTLLVSSPLQRCAALGTALLADLYSTGLILDTRLQELDFGNWEMQPWDHIGKSAVDAWISSGFEAHHGGESVQTLDARVASWLEDARASYPAEHTVWVITHAGVIRSILRQLSVCSFAESLAWPIEYGHFIELILE